ncbi:MAG: sugar ABC transporter permease [Lachnospiraceae bacterium]|jgi:multiple sugar transport system permease protein|nr:sugar ABC transporter permease [Lachnospiraceae bacterium]MCH4067095.1 sugar ABC transporter permease [Lachnospiraceae bacterium]MCH4113121.1 sugar ABC transporter permease [Lachnospiraceae bacterium]MCI1353532.1 sugar ABC transporter permease [Lachnospiraceae bacterium]MCI1367563.1 sugar ABC transporter permease [Lachnospiraceae bacterium]
MKKKRTMAQKRTREGYSFILPGFIYMIVVLGYPLVYNVILSFENVNVKTFASKAYTFIGFQNYVDLFHNATFLLVLKNTFVFTFYCLLFQFSIGFIMALFFSKKFTLAGPIRGMILVAYMMPMSVTALLGKNMFDKSSGVVNDLLMKTHIISAPVDWLLQPNTAMAAVIAMNCWVGIPFNMLLLTSGLTNISNDVLEAAEVDGANHWQRFWKVTFPLLKPAIMAVLMLGFIYTFKAFDLMFIMTSGGPLNSTDVLGTYAYDLSFKQYEFSKGSATAMVLFLILLVIGFFYLRMVATEDD